MKRKIALSLCVALLTALLAGCWDYTEVNMQDYVFGVSIDREGSGYKVCIETLRVSGSPEEGTSAGVIVKTEGANIFDAVRAGITRAGKKLYWGHFQLAVIGESVAKEQLQEVLDVFNRAQDVYLNISLLVARGCTAEDILTAKTAKESMVTDHILEIFDNKKASRHFQRVELWQVYRDMSLSNTYTLPVVSLDDEKVPMVNGSAIMRAGKLSGFLSGDETVALSLLTENAAGGYIPKVQVTRDLGVSLEILRNQTRMRAEIVNGKPELTIKSEILVSLSSADNACDIMNKITQKQISDAAQKYIYGQLGELTDRVRKQKLGDLFHWGHKVQVASPAWWRENGGDWEAVQSEMPIHWDVRVSLNSAGMSKNTITFG